MFSLFRSGLAILAALFVVACGASARADTVVDLELVLAVDISLSMDMEEQRLQRDGYVAALRDPEVMKAIHSGPHGRIAVTYIEWAGPHSQSTVLPWTIIEVEASAEEVATKLAELPISRQRMTSISSALAYSRRQFDANPDAGSRRVIDVSGDGPNNSGAPVGPIREELIRDGITINGLPIIIHPSQSSLFDISYLDQYYADCVIGGTGAFMIPREKTEFTTAIRQKLLLEISVLEPPARIIKVQDRPEPGKTNCLVGEQLWQHVQGCFAPTIDLPLAGFVVADASLPRRHHPDQARRGNVALQAFDDTHRTQRIGDHEVHEIFGRHLTDRLRRIWICRPGIDE
jgi:hypothetical protein